MEPFDPPMRQIRRYVSRQRRRETRQSDGDGDDNRKWRVPRLTASEQPSPNRALPCRDRDPSIQDYLLILKKN